MGRDRRPPRRGTRKPAAQTSWDPLATWYNGWVGEYGSEYHRAVALPAILGLLDAKRGERILDMGCGQGVLAESIHRAGAHYVGVDASPRLIEMARKQHGAWGRFLLADAGDLSRMRDLEPGSVDAAVFLLSLQDMDPLEKVLTSTARMLKASGRVIVLMTHPAFRVPRQSGWGIDEGRKLVYRRIDRYLTPLPVPMKPFPGQQGVSRSFHRPVSAYVNSLSECGLRTDRMEEIPAHKLDVAGSTRRGGELARQEIPLFLGLRAVRCGA
ncbi:MAG: class I SAM-dependent methyltransferase [Chloroflexota bacterium]